MEEKLSFSHILQTVKKLALLNGIFLAGMSLFRLVFFLYYRTPGMLGAEAGYLLKAFFMGVRFDLVVVAYINILVTLTLLLVWAVRNMKLFRFWLHAVKFYYFLLFSAVFILLCIDFGFFSYFKTHINILIFGVFEDDTKALFSTLKDNYNLYLVGLGFAALVGAVYVACRQVINSLRRHNFDLKSYGAQYQIGLAVLLIVGNTLAARGSFNLFPLGVMDAEISPDDFINKVGINGIFTLQEAIESRMKENANFTIADKVGYDGAPKRAFADFLGVPEEQLDENTLVAALARTTPKDARLEKLQPNVVVIVMESFGSDLLQYNSPAFNVMGELKTHFQIDNVFYNFLPGDMGTIGSLETVMLSIPKRPGTKAITQSKFAYNAFPACGALPFKRAGYDTVFLYGGNMGWRNVQSVVTHIGFDTAEGEGSMDKSWPRNQWGVYDEYLFEQLFDRLTRKDGKPKFILAMSTSNHPPYSLPPSYKLLPLQVPEALAQRITGDSSLAKSRFMTYQYSNQKLGELITRIKASPLGKNTIIAVTGDHNFWSVFNYPRECCADQDGVPFYLYIPPALRKGPVDTNTFGSHIDILPTLYNLALSDQEYIAVGVDLLDKNAPHVAYNVDGIIMNPSRAVRYSPINNTTNCFSWDPQHPRRFAEMPADEEHQRLLTRYKSALAVTEYYLRNPREKKKETTH